MAAGAHEIGTTKAAMRFPADGTYVLAIETDAAPLMEKLGARELTHCGEAIRGRVALAFDGQTALPAIECRMLADGGALVALTGPVPSGAKAFTFRFGWVFTTYSLQVGGHGMGGGRGIERAAGGRGHGAGFALARGVAVSGAGIYAYPAVRAGSRPVCPGNLSIEQQAAQCVIAGYCIYGGTFDYIGTEYVRRVARAGFDSGAVDRGVDCVCGD